LQQLLSTLGDQEFWITLHHLSQEDVQHLLVIINDPGEPYDPAHLAPIVDAQRHPRAVLAPSRTNLTDGQTAITDMTEAETPTEVKEPTRTLRSERSNTTTLRWEGCTRLHWAEHRTAHHSGICNGSWHHCEPPYVVGSTVLLIQSSGIGEHTLRPCAAPPHRRTPKKLL
jgi:hypothetical protein